MVTIEDAEGIFNDISLEIPYRLTKLLSELNAQGYLVIDQR